MKVVCANLGENLGYETCIDDITVVRINQEEKVSKKKT
jgi:hypothetical protein